MINKKEECLAALKLLADEADYEDWTVSVQAYHLLKDLINKYFDKSFKNKDLNLRKLRINSKIILSYDDKLIELEVFDIDSKEVLKRFKFKKKELADLMTFESVFDWLEQSVE